MYNNPCVVYQRTNYIFGRDISSDTEKYSSGRRGAPAKGIGRVTGARVQIPLSPLFYQEDSGSAYEALPFFMINQIYTMMPGSKAPYYDTNGLFRTSYSHNPTKYSHIVGLSSHFYAHILAGPKVYSPLMSVLMWGKTF